MNLSLVPHLLMGHMIASQVEFNKAAQSLTDALVPNAQKKTALNRLVKVVLNLYTDALFLYFVYFFS